MEANLWLSAAADLAQIRVRVPNHVVYQSFVAETVLLDLETGTHHELDGNAGRLLEVLESSRSIVAAAATLAQERPESAGELERICSDLCERLLAVGLISISCAD